jgi:hypothetical protein
MFFASNLGLFQDPKTRPSLMNYYIIIKQGIWLSRGCYNNLIVDVQIDRKMLVGLWEKSLSYMQEVSVMFRTECIRKCYTRPSCEYNRNLNPWQIIEEKSICKFAQETRQVMILSLI